MKKVIEDVIKECERQNEKWGVQNRSSVEWIAILTEEVGEAAKEAVDFYFQNPSKDTNQLIRKVQKERLDNFRKELIQVAAVAVQAVENIDRDRNLTSE